MYALLRRLKLFLNTYIMGLTVTDRFLKYVTFDTKSSEETGTTPSTPGQRVFAEALVKELEALGLEDISIDEHSYVMATLPANTDSEETPVIGFIAHLDTSPDMSGKDVNPRIVSYQGGDIILNKEDNVVLSQAMFPELNDYVGQELIVTDGKHCLEPTIKPEWQPLWEQCNILRSIRK